MPRLPALILSLLALAAPACALPVTVSVNGHTYSGDLPEVPPATQPATQPTTAPATAPATAPVTQPTTVPATAPATAPSTQPVLPAGTLRVLSVEPAGLAAALKLARPGDCLLVSPGTVHAGLTPTVSGTAANPITVMAATPGTVTIDATGLPYAWRGTAYGQPQYVNLSGINFRGGACALQTSTLTLGSHCTATDVLVDGSESGGVQVQGDGAVLLRVTAQNCGQQGIKGESCVNVTATGCTSRYNNRGLKVKPNWAGRPNTFQLPDGKWYVNASWESGGGKWSRCNNVVVDGWDVSQNGGQGIAVDIDARNFTVRNSRIHDQAFVQQGYEAVGIQYEISFGKFLCENTTFSNNVGGHLMIATSRGVEVRGCTFQGGFSRFTNWPRGEQYALSDLYFHDNRLIGSFWWPGGTGWDVTSPQKMNIRIDGNVYQRVNATTYSPTLGPSVNGLAVWGGLGTIRTIDDMRRLLGQERTGWVE